jgi:flagellar biosynthetic protein FliR
VDLQLELNRIFLVFTRTAGILAGTPVLSGRTVPLAVKLWVTMTVALCLAPVVSTSAKVPTGWAPFVQAILREALIGFTIGFVVLLFFLAVQMAGTLIDLPIGFRMAEIVSPQVDARSAPLGQLYFLTAVLILLATDGYQWIFRAIAESFEVLPLLAAPRGFAGTIAEGMALLIHRLLKISLQIAFPVMAAIFIADVLSGIISRAVPQINIFILGFPIKIILGLLMVMLTMPYFGSFLKGVFEFMGRTLFEVIAALGS